MRFAFNSSMFTLEIFLRIRSFSCDECVRVLILSKNIRKESGVSLCCGFSITSALNSVKYFINRVNVFPSTLFATLTIKSSVT
jgi:hypothetical protein